MPVRTARAFSGLAVLLSLAGCATAHTNSQSLVFVVGDTRDLAKCRGGTLEVLAVLDEHGSAPKLKFASPPSSFALPPGRYRLYFNERLLRSNFEKHGECGLFTVLHPMSAEITVNGADNYFVSTDNGGLALVPVVVHRRK